MSNYQLGPGYKAIPPEELPEGWSAQRLGDLVRVSQGGRLGMTKENNYSDQGVAAYSAAGQDGCVDRAEFQNQRGVVLSAIGANCGRCFYAEGDWTTLANVQAILPAEGLDAKFLYYRTNIENYWMRSGSAQPFIKPSSIKTNWIAFPKPPQQRRIATILSTLDEVIEATEKLVEKHQQIKAGLMHDLFTRGLWTRPELARGDHHGLPCQATAQEGQLRPTPEEAPGLYQESPLGLIPKAWKLSSIGEIAESMADGPFGSNLKTEHYVVEPGVRVVRLQNIHDTIYNDEDRAFVSESHANYLIRNQVVSGDILVAGLGEDKHVVARACSYPHGLPPAINKADCFRLRCDKEKALNPFVMFYLNTSIARGQVRRYEQGVTRRRINGGNLKRVFFGLPSLREQEKAIAMLDSAGSEIDSITEQIAKLRQQKQGLMHDLLTGRVPVAESFTSS